MSPTIVVTKQLNFERVLHPSTVGQRLGPDTQGRMYTVVGIEDRADGEPGSTALLEWRPGA